MINKKIIYGVGIAAVALWLFRPKGNGGVLTPVRSYPGPDGPPAIRNNNPFNVIESELNAWQGKVTYDYPRLDAFEKFVDYYHGLRAGIKNAKTQYDRGYNSIDKLIRRLTPPASAGGDNPNSSVDDFVHNVATEMGHTPFRKFAWTKNNVEALARAITKVEAGKPNFSQTDFEKVWKNV